MNSYLTVEEAAAILAQDGIVGMPTETVYGLAANAFSPQAIAKVFEAKKRPWFDPLIVHIPSADSLSHLVKSVPALAQKLAEAFWPGPLTMVFEKLDVVPDLVTAGAPTVAVRVPSHPVAQALLRACPFPLAAPSANLFGRVSPTSSRDVLDQLEGRIDGVIEGGDCAVGVESTIIDFTGPQARMLRPGGVSREEIEAVIGPLATLETTAGEDGNAMPAPGTCKRHYSPLTPIQFVGDAVVSDDSRVGLIAFGKGKGRRRGFVKTVNLSDSGDLCEAATHLYSALRQMDLCGLDYVIVEEIPATGLGLAINDRLRRAAARD
jgi:L-threonylcarbamoyladenylate synthase